MNAGDHIANQLQEEITWRSHTTLRARLAQMRLQRAVARRSRTLRSQQRAGRQRQRSSDELGNRA